MLTSPLRKALFPLVALCLCLALRPQATHPPRPRLARLPRITLWAWERREDLRALDPKLFAVAYLDQTLTLGSGVHSQPRREPVAFPAAIARIPVVRVEAPRFATLDASQERQAVDAILTSAREPGIAALQIDFDATRSQRPFYRDLLVDLRRRMPPNLPLSITALASWCSSDDWLHSLPVDEAVPMFFRMEPFRDAPHATPGHRPARAETVAYLNAFSIHEPLCQQAAGVSTTEPWPETLAGKRVYVFPDFGWQHEIPSELPRRLP